MINLCKIRLFYFIVLLWACSCSAKKSLVNNPLLVSGITVKITGTTAEINGTRVSIFAGDKYNRKIFWADTIKGDRFDVTVNVPGPGFYEMQFIGDYPSGSTPQRWMHWINLYLEDKCSYIIETGTADSILYNHSKVFSSSPVQKMLSLFEESYTDGYDFKQAEIARKSIAADLLEKAHRDAEYKKLSTNIASDEDELKLFSSKFTREFALKNPGSIVSVHKLLEVNDMQRNYKTYLDIYNHLDEAIKKKYDAVNFKMKLNAVENANQKH